MPKALDLKGRRFERLTVTLKRVDVDLGDGSVVWECVCDCGSVTLVRAGKLSSGQTRSCGCLRKDLTTTHGLRKSPEYAAWRNIKKRCHNPKHPQYVDYGARGITMCDEWRNSFEAFYRDVGPRPSPELSIERKNNNEGYSKTNCRWATRTEQNNNKRNNLYFEFDGEKKSLAEWCRELNVSYDAVYERIRWGATFEDAVDTVIRSTTQ